VITSDLIALYPNLYHMAAEGSWPSIERLGLLSTSELTRQWGVAPPDVRESLLGQRRPSSVTITSPVFGAATIRDQLPLDERSLAAALVDMSPHDWYEALNERVFFFLQPERLRTLLNARSYRNSEQVVITVDTQSFVQAHESEIELCKINSGFAQPHNHVSRGRETFKSIEAYPHPDRVLPRRSAPWDVAELCVPSAVVDLARHVVRVERVQADRVLERIR